MLRLILAVMMFACSSPVPDICAGPNACCYYWCNKGTCDCVGGKAPDPCQGENACCYYWCGQTGCSCTNYVKNPPPTPTPDIVVPDTEFEEVNP